MSGKAALPELSAAVTTAAILAGLDLSSLDAVYLGQPYCLLTEGNLLVDLDGLKAAISGVKAAGKQAYVTTPIIPKAQDFPKVERLVTAAAEGGADAIELHDVGVFRWTEEHFPKLPIHMSSLANIYQPETAAFYRDRGVARIIPANELLVDEARQIKDAVTGVEFAVPVHGRLPLGMAYTCLLRTKFPENDLGACRQQCADEYFLDMGDWRMRSVGTALISGEDFSMIEHLPGVWADSYDGWRLETHFDNAARINALAAIYRRGLLEAAGGIEYQSANFKAEVESICGLTSNGWRFGLSGRDYYSIIDENPQLVAEIALRIKSEELS